MMQYTRRLPMFCCAIGMSMLLPTMMLETSLPSVPSSFHRTTANYNSVLLVGIDAVDDTNAVVVASIVPYTDGITMVLDNSDESFGDKEDALDFVVMEPEPVLLVLSAGAGVATTTTTTTTTATATSAAATTTNASAQETNKASRNMIATTATTSSSGVPETKTTNTTAFGDSFVFPPKPDKASGFLKKLLVLIYCDLINTTIIWCIVPFNFFLHFDGVHEKHLAYPIVLLRILFGIFFSSLLKDVPLINLAQGLIPFLILHRLDVRLDIDIDGIQRIQLAYAYFRDQYGDMLWFFVVSLFFSRRAQTSVK